jgi:periplasmic divalent cation tolerance protein
MKFFLVYVTCADMQEATAISEDLIKDKLIACANILPAMHSLCMWQGNLERAEEAVLLLKTAESFFPRVREKIRALHSYKTPAIFSLPIADIDSDYAEWAEGALS